MKEVMKFEDVYRTYEVLTAKLCEQGNDPLECAGVMMGQAMKMYKTALTDDEYQALMVVIAGTVDAINYEFDTPTSQTKH